ncbi:MAG: hypothetical protein KDD50_01610, partial [Bdellovibrionales bacterium]|nr:hypothetical protein [Bdellovibrionales bacterium]
MNSIKITFLILLASYSLSCTRSKDPIAHFKMTMPTKTQLLAAQGQFVNTQQFNSNNPTSLSDINCFAIVVAADYLNDSSCKILDSSGVAVGTKPFGRLEGFFMLGQEVTLPAIPSEPGTEGEISIYGSKSTTGICEPAGAINDTNYTRPVFLGYSKVLMNPSDTPVNVRINISYTNGAATNQFVGDCQGPHGPGNHNDPGNTTGNLVSYPTPNDGNPLYMFEADVQTLAPIINGENPVSYSISPSVTPHGLIFDTNTGSINGTVNSSFASAQTYTVTATYANNTTTSTSFDLEFPKRFRVNKLNTGADDVIDGICYNTAEGGCTLLAALQEANDSGNTVNTHILLDDLGTPALFPFGVPFVFSNPNAIELHIVGHLDANGDPNSVMDAAANAILQVNGSSSLHLVNLKFMDAMESSVGGAALFFSSTGDLVMDHVYMYGNYTNASSGGGAVKVAGASTVKILKSTFELNSANNGRGGALYITGSGILIDIIDSDFESNTVAASGFDGGAIYITDTAANLLIRGTSFNYNSIANAAWGGGALYFGGANLTIENSAFYNNTATNSSFGGALYLNIGNALSDWYFTNVS